jgi:transposase
LTCFHPDAHPKRIERGASRESAKIEIETQTLQAVYEKIELPKTVPIVTQIRQYGGECPHCEKQYIAAVTVGIEQGSPFGKSVESLATYLRHSHAISYERLSQMMEKYMVSRSLRVG